MHCMFETKLLPQLQQGLQNMLLVLGHIVLIMFCIVFVKMRQRQKLKRLRKVWDSVPKDVVTLHMYKRGPTCPNVTPFGLKLELFLQMTKINYVTDSEVSGGPKGKTPWITINGRDIPDSQFVIEYLSEKFDKDIEKGFSEKEKAVSRAFRIMLEDHFYWCRVMESWIFLEGRDNSRMYGPGQVGFPAWLPQKVLDVLYKRAGLKYCLPLAKAQGVGRHSRTEVEHLGKSALKAYSSYLGDKPFLLGDQPCLADVTAFAFVTLFVSKPKDSESVFKKYIEEDCKNLVQMRRRLIKNFWPDYDKYVYGCDLPKN